MPAGRQASVALIELFPRGTAINSTGTRRYRASRSRNSALMSWHREISPLPPRFLSSYSYRETSFVPWHSRGVRFSRSDPRFELFVLSRMSLRHNCSRVKRAGNYYSELSNRKSACKIILSLLPWDKCRYSSARYQFTCLLIYGRRN